MSKKGRKDQTETSSFGLSTTSGEKTLAVDTINTKSSKSSWFVYLKSHWWAVALIAFLSLGTLGAGLKYLEEDAQRQMENGKRKTDNGRNQSFLNRINPFLPVALPNPTPQLSKELIYAGDLLLNVEDANATAVPPADLAIWRRDTINNTGTWMVMGGQGSQQTFFSWGNASENLSPAILTATRKPIFQSFVHRTVNGISSKAVLLSANGFQFRSGRPTIFPRLPTMTETAKLTLPYFVLQTELGIS